MSDVFDLVVIGGGPAGEKAAVAAAYFKKRVAVIEKAPEGPGGAAVHTGTLPSKTLRETALYLTGFQRRQLYRQLPTEFNTKAHSVADLMCRLPDVWGKQSEQIGQNLKRHNVEIILGEGQFVGPHQFQIGDKQIESKFFLLATGSSPRRPDCFDFTDPQVYDSDTILGLDRIPETLAIIGGGVIGSEYACVFAALGVEIRVIEARPRIMSFLDHDISSRLMQSMKSSGIQFRVDDGVERLTRDSDVLVLDLKSGEQMKVDKVLVSAGRTGNSKSLGLGKIGVVLDDRKQVVVDTQFRTNLPHVFAAGDIVGRPGLASTAMEQGRLAVAAMFDLEVPKRDWEAIPYGIYTIPEACLLGPNEEELKAQGIPYVVGRSELRHNARGQIIGDIDGLVKLLFHQETRKLLGVHLICERATELIHIGQAVMRLGGGIDYFLESIMTYPSLSEAYKYAAYDALGELDRGRDRPVALK
jgi:NAD(P) transhydrogenase